MPGVYDEHIHCHCAHFFDTIHHHHPVFCQTTLQTRKEGCRPDKDDRRNCLTSIYWVPNATSPVLNVVHNTSDHVHYYQGGVPFEYTIYDPTTKQIQVQVLGPDLANGQSLQVPVAGGLWKCGRLLPDSLPGVDADYCIIAEAVGPGFDFHDFNFVNAKDLEEQGMDVETRQRLEPFLHNMETAFDNAVSSSLSKDSVEKKDKMFDKHYDYAG